MGLFDKFKKALDNPAPHVHKKTGQPLNPAQ